MAGTGGSLAGSVTITPIPRSNLGSQDNLAVLDNAITTLTPPVNANIAEIFIYDADQFIIFRTDGNAPTNAPVLGMTGYQSIELEGTDELANFQAIATVGNSVRLYVEYKSDTQAINN